MRRRLLSKLRRGGVPASESAPCDICLYDKIADKLIIVKGDLWSIELYPSDKYSPVGIVVVPGTHNVYGDGSCGVMSLKAMNCDTPSTGSTSEQTMHWGVYDIDISELPDLNQVPIGNTSDGVVLNVANQGHLPSDKFTLGTQCFHDTDIKYNGSPYIPSPYLTDGSRNPGYYQTSPPSSSSNALADFDGIGNTAKIITQRGIKDYNSWILVKTDSASYPAASCCDMFHTEGTQQGDWYLPACGELGYIMPSFDKINDTIGKMRIAYGLSVGVKLANYIYWSSTESSSKLARCLMKDGGVFGSDKASGYYVRAWLRVS